MKTIIKIIVNRNKLVFFVLFLFIVYIFLVHPRSYSNFFRKAELKEAKELEIYFGYNGRDEHEAMITDKYCCHYRINDEETIERIQKVFQSISMKPRYKEVSGKGGLIWNIKISGQGENYILNMSGGSSGRKKFFISSGLLDKKIRCVAKDKSIFPNEYEISEEDNEKIIQVLFEAINDNIKDMTIQDAVRLSEENAERREFMYYYMLWGDRTDTNQVYIPILNTDMKIEICYDKIIQEPEYIEPIEKAVLHDKKGNEYEYFSEEARELLRRETGEVVSGEAGE